MIVGVPKELKDGENRVGLDPTHVAKLLGAVDGLAVVVESGAGIGAGFSNEDYVAAGAFILSENDAIYGISNMIVKVKEVLPEEYSLVRNGQAIAGYFHLPANPDLQRLIDGKQLKTLVYENVVDAQGRRPVLLPMSIIAGEAAGNKSYDYLKERRGGVVDLLNVKALVIGRGNVGLAAARTLVERGLQPKNITILESDPTRVNHSSEYTEGVCEPQTVARVVADSDIIIGAAASRKKEAPKVIAHAVLLSMRPNGVFFDVAVDEGGICEDTRPTSHSEPTFMKDGILICAIPNLPGAYPERATHDLSAAAYPYIVKFLKENEW